MNTVKSVVLCDLGHRHKHLLPLSFTRPVSEFRVGITTISQKWAAMLGVDKCLCKAEEYLVPKFCAPEPGHRYLYISSNLLPDEALVEAVKGLGCGCALVDGDGGVLACVTDGDPEDVSATPGRTVYDGKVCRINNVFDVFLCNGDQIRADFRRITAGRESRRIPSSCRVIGNETAADGTPNIFIEEGASVEGAFLNVTAGPIYIGRGATVMEGSCLRGPLAVGDNAKVNMGAKIYGDTTIGPWCKVGGEINNAVMFGYSNKAHDGFLGNAVIGEWCNIGAGVSASNLKNDYSKIRIWNYATHSFMRTDLQFCGLIMGDHSKIGINCMINTATVIGVGVNLHGCGFPRTFIPDFSEGSPAAGFTDVPLKKFNDIAGRVMSRRGLCVTEADKAIFEAISKESAQYR